VVGGNAAFETVKPFEVAEHTEVFIEKGSAPIFHDFADFVALRRIREANASAQDLPHSLVATNPTKNEEDCWQ
jgi:hypothetical protein